MDRYSVEGSTLTGIADAIREKTGGSEEIKVEDMAGKIGEISGGGEETEFVTLTFNNKLNLSGGGMAFCYYDESSKNWELCYSTGTYSLNDSNTSYKLRKNSRFMMTSVAWEFSPSNSVTMISNGIYEIYTDAVVTLD